MTRASLMAVVETADPGTLSSTQLENYVDEPMQQVISLGIPPERTHPDREGLAPRAAYEPIAGRGGAGRHTGRNKR